MLYVLLYRDWFFRLCSFSDLEQVHSSWLKTDLQLSLYVCRDVKARKYAESIYIPFRSSDVEISLVEVWDFYSIRKTVNS